MRSLKTLSSSFVHQPESEEEVDRRTSLWALKQVRFNFTVPLASEATGDEEDDDDFSCRRKHGGGVVCFEGECGPESSVGVWGREQFSL